MELIKKFHRVAIRSYFFIAFTVVVFLWLANWSLFRAHSDGYRGGDSSINAQVLGLIVGLVVFIWLVLRALHIIGGTVPCFRRIVELRIWLVWPWMALLIPFFVHFTSKGFTSARESEVVLTTFQYGKGMSPLLALLAGVLLCLGWMLDRAKAESRSLNG